MPAITITIPKELLGKLKKLAENDRRSLSNYISITLKDYMSAREVRTTLTQEEMKETMKLLD